MSYEHEYTINWGDPSHDGHCHVVSEEIGTNYYWNDIELAYQKTEREWGCGLTLDALSQSLVDYGDKELNQDLRDKLMAAGYPEDYTVGRYSVLGIYLFMATQSLPDLDWDFCHTVSQVDLYIGYGMLVD